MGVFAPDAVGVEVDEDMFDGTRPESTAPKIALRIWRSVAGCYGSEECLFVCGEVMMLCCADDGIRGSECGGFICL